MRYRLKRTVDGHRKGSHVFKFNGCTYGCISEEGTACSIDGKNPFFEIPTNALEEDPLPPITDEHVEKVCRPGCGAETCRYLIVGPHGFQCAKHTNMHDYLDKRVAEGELRAQGDNCEGRSIPEVRS